MKPELIFAAVVTAMPILGYILARLTGDAQKINKY